MGRWTGDELGKMAGGGWVGRWMTSWVGGWGSSWVGCRVQEWSLWSGEGEAE